MWIFIVMYGIDSQSAFVMTVFDSLEKASKYMSDYQTSYPELAHMYFIQKRYLY